MNADESCSNSGSFLILPTSGRGTGVFRGVGMVAKIVSENTGILWWVRRSNHYESVWFHASKTFKNGSNLAETRLPDALKEGKFN
jgi:hypothetical protein